MSRCSVRMETMSSRTRLIIAISATVASIASALGAYVFFVQSSARALIGEAATDSTLAASGVLLWVFSVIVTIVTGILLWRWSKNDYREALHLGATPLGDRLRPRLYSYLLGVLTAFVALQVILLLLLFIPISV